MCANKLPQLLFGFRCLLLLGSALPGGRNNGSSEHREAMDEKEKCSRHKPEALRFGSRPLDWRSDLLALDNIERGSCLLPCGQFRAQAVSLLLRSKNHRPSTA